MRWVSIGGIEIGREERQAVMQVLDSNRISEGPKIQAFEREFARFVGTKHAITTSSGTAALIAGLLGLRHHEKYDLGKRPKVITTPVTYISTSNAVVLSGLEPVYVDIEPETFLITPDSIRAYLEGVDDQEQHGLILPVHLMGYACDMGRINKIAREYGLLTFEDSAQAHGTVYNGRKTGSLSLLAGFSFYVAHNIQVGEMGAITTDDTGIYNLLRKIKANGRLCECRVCTRSKGICPKKPKGDQDIDPRFTHDIISYNFKTTEFQGALGLVQLHKARHIIEQRLQNVRYLNEVLAPFSDLLQLPKYSQDVSYLGYPIVIRDPDSISRKRLREGLEKLGVETRPLFGCIPTQQPAYAHLKEKYAGKLPNAEYAGLNGFYIGCHQYLKRQDLDHVAKAFKQVLPKK